MPDRDFLFHAGAAFKALTGVDVVATSDLPEGVAAAIDPDDHTVYIRADLPCDRAQKALALARQWIEHGPAAAPQFTTPDPRLQLLADSPDDDCARTA